MGQALYRKYRSKTFSEVIGQDHIVKTLQTAISSGRLSHAYLFSGPRGVGKTSVARILAHEINELSYNEDQVHLDIIEIDAASNRRIDEIRDLRDKVNITPTSARYKVYIIDEVHMLTKESFNALLKTLEEPPAHCIFILATTEAHKLPETVISRTQKFNFKPIDQNTLGSHLSSIAKKEKIDIEPAAIELLAEHGSGSFRDGISLLDQLAGHQGKIAVEDLRHILGLPPTELINQIIDHVKKGKVDKLLEVTSVVRQQSISPAAVATALADRLRRQLADGATGSWITILMRGLLDVPTSSEPYDMLEIVLAEVATNNRSDGATSRAVGPSLESDASPAVVKKTAEPRAVSHISQKQATKFSIDDWPMVLSLVKEKSASHYTALRLAQPQIDGSLLTLSFRFALHQQKIDRAPAKELIAQIIESNFGSKLKIVCTVDKTIKTPSKKTGSPATKLSSEKIVHPSISNIFGATEVLES
ncbi:DNA polymerase III, subunit gamma and tau [Candidatus Saccharibacteria bacterium RIFCSPLOWO2_01_FULL_48_13]|nr:MAG: DNA polymerase III, subunit gamma and tau [Candidatus Saccharibacteria bacterium RIFCSPHIGHO2_01_FULL_48_12]OGL35297.1 MAG: DNA polymerase III, subunit gamma and tau [Candidatus Saccharibacteria bacterium RIFCSPHIGHO2_12_FULL_48_21]OGL37533.1 MAG: DNA polymerase III, subunit gamma and tau [Candidatus Saccharibacteria bacterium RIFCSPLOWO2_01_FULL_48_13]